MVQSSAGREAGGGLVPEEPVLEEKVRRYSYLTACIYQLVLESQLPHEIVNLLFTITN